ncbi:cytochrome c oxidase subunit 3 [Coraliomargarita akajimensis]|uniref:Cytochrome bo(3) ubiquinol oxidase subunit 3 n=1 Tax=Coraliomargarita akajimensis (strain DSM 45221 / IAM 15411 / JCM 23193 / KCTC 12865 / 04OKA010-24) TaxID=583355 RepID=D5EPE2_CORAD|nr:heme-copper oxidase subunit III [Coraliomargarita akajimensis]ADE53679.1 cytochrome c oxidase subunit III [Coraliomargarita akajimensis DSM 45221]
MSDTAIAHHDDSHHKLIVDNKKLLMWLFLGSDCMFFGTLISTHLIYRKLYPDEFEPTTLFSLELTSFSTFILLMSSFLMALSVSAMHKGQLKSFRRNVSGVIFFGLIFLGCQVYEFSEFVHHDLTLQTGTFGSTFFLLTGIHGVHVAIGVFWLISMLFYSMNGKMDAHESAVDVEVAGLYWHFVDIVWIIIFTAVYLIEFIGKTGGGH